jgi:single-strand DNA-binding protein
MSRSLNRWDGIGHLGSDPETRFMPNGDPVCTFSIACSDDYVDKQGNKIEKTEWVRIVMWRRLAEIAGEYLHKGSKIYVTGKLTTRKYEKDGVTQYVTEIVANNMQMLDSKPADGSRPPSQGQPARQASTSRSAPTTSHYEESDWSDDIPFN